MQKAIRFTAGSFSALANVIASLNCPFITVENGIVNIDGRVTMDGTDGVTTKKDGTVIAVSQINWRGAGSYNVAQYVAASDNLFYVCIRGYYESRLELIYEKMNGHSYYGLVSSSGFGTLSYQPLSAFPIYDGDDSVQYRHRPMLNYSCESGTLEYCQDYLFRTTSIDNLGTVSGVEKAIPNPNLINCTNVSSCVMVTMNNKNYFSLGPNWLFPMES